MTSTIAGLLDDIAEARPDQRLLLDVHGGVLTTHLGLGSHPDYVGTIGFPMTGLGKVAKSGLAEQITGDDR